MAACLAGGPDVHGSHRTGLRLHGAVDLSGRLEVLTDGYRRVRLPGVFVHRTIHLLPKDVTIIDGIPVTSLIRSLIDVGGRQTPEALGSMIDRAIVAGQLDLTAEGTIAVDGRSSKTSLPGVFAAGDVIDPSYRQAVTAAGSGTVAALDAEHYLASLEDS